MANGSCFGTRLFGQRAWRWQRRSLRAFLAWPMRQDVGLEGLIRSCGASPFGGSLPSFFFNAGLCAWFFGFQRSVLNWLFWYLSIHRTLQLTGGETNGSCNYPTKLTFVRRHYGWKPEKTLSGASKPDSEVASGQVNKLASLALAFQQKKWLCPTFFFPSMFFHGEAKEEKGIP